MFNKHFYITLLLFVLALPAQASVSIGVTPNTAQLHVGDTVSFSINVSGLSDDVALGSYDLSLWFDPALLQFDGTIFGDPLLGDQLDIAGLGLNFPSALASGDLVSLIEFSWDDPQTLLGQQAKDFTIASLFFTAISSGSSPLNLTINSLADHLSNPMIADGRSSSVLITAIPLPSAFWMFAPIFAFGARKILL